jgi:hypothetical protein
MRDALVDSPAGDYPAGNFFPANIGAVRFVNYAGGNYALAANSPYKNAGTDGRDIGAIDRPLNAWRRMRPHVASHVSASSSEEK